ncbi:Disulfide bond reductase DsbH precursor [Gimesia alba]|uniref:Disulfide bond reductase DsbH n=2 Tax=Gimesia alba TaxID=2527973 RepID=A0A517RIJ4_9PLAN|nr:Disulfide bond reductase DsbH precursor [Gimesia alba]
MSKWIPLTLACLFHLVAVTVNAATGPDWIRDFEKGKQIAKSEKKDLFLLFTGHGWCYHCELLDQAIFQKQEFVDTMSKQYVFVELDFNFGNTPEEKKRETRFRQLQSHYLAPGAPTVVLTDSDGKPYAFLTGYDNKTSLQDYLNLVTTAQKAKTKRDALFTAAAAESGTSRANLLSHALDSIRPQLGDIDERGDEPLLHFYKDTVEEILDLTDNTGSIANKYISLRNSRTAWIADNAVFDKLKYFDSQKDYAGAIKFVDESLKTIKNEKVRWQLEMTRQAYLEWGDQFEQALANCQRLLALDEIPEDSREAFLNREAFNLFRLNRIDEGIAHINQRLRDAGSDKAKRLKLFNWQIQLMHNRAPVEKSIEACQRYRNETKRGTDDWLQATYFLALELRRAERHLQALKVIKEFLAEDRTSYQLLDAAESLIALKRDQEAADVLEEARSLIQPLKTSPRKSEVDEYQRLSKTIDKLTRSMSNRSVPQ